MFCNRRCGQYGQQTIRDIAQVEGSCTVLKQKHQLKHKFHTILFDIDLTMRRVYHLKDCFIMRHAISELAADNVIQ